MAYSEGEAVFSTKSGSVAKVWAALRERSFEEGPAMREVHSKYNKKVCVEAKAK